MADMTNYALPAPTAWGNIRLYYAEAAEDGAMVPFEDLISVGYVLEDSIETNNEEGDTLQLFEEGHILRDELRLNSTFSVTFTIIGIPPAIADAFWDAEVTGTGATQVIQVNSFVNNNRYAFRLDAPTVLSQAFEAPYCSVNMVPSITSTEGWTAECTITVLNGPADYAFRIVRVQAPTPAP